jgi:hypothetical protein
MWSDTTEQGQTVWTELASKPVSILQATVDTSDAGFINTPTYFARVVGAPAGSAGYVASTAAGSFTFGLRLPASVTNPGYAIEWFAIEI